MVVRKGIESTCVLSFFFLLLGNRIVLFFSPFIFQCVNNHYAKFEYKGMQTVYITDYPTQTPLSISDGKN